MPGKSIFLFHILLENWANILALTLGEDAETILIANYPQMTSTGLHCKSFFFF